MYALLHVSPDAFPTPLGEEAHHTSCRLTAAQPLLAAHTAARDIPDLPHTAKAYHSGSPCQEAVCCSPAVQALLLYCPRSSCLPGVPQGLAGWLGQPCLPQVVGPSEGEQHSSLQAAVTLAPHRLACLLAECARLPGLHK